MMVAGKKFKNGTYLRNVWNSDKEDDKADGRGDFIMLVLLNSFGGGLTIICASGVQKVVNF